MVAGTNRMQKERATRYPDYDGEDMANLARVRAGINAGVGRERSAFSPEEADRRVAFYAAQVAACGQITRWMAPAPPRPVRRYRTRWAFGDALGRHGCQG